jgi:hypothetical protein
MGVTRGVAVVCAVAGAFGFAESLESEGCCAGGVVTCAGAMGSPQPLPISKSAANIIQYLFGNEPAMEMVPQDGVCC